MKARTLYCPRDLFQRNFLDLDIFHFLLQHSSALYLAITKINVGITYGFLMVDLQIHCFVSGLSKVIAPTKTTLNFSKVSYEILNVYAKSAKIQNAVCKP